MFLFSVKIFGSIMIFVKVIVILKISVCIFSDFWSVKVDKNVKIHKLL